MEFGQLVRLHMMKLLLQVIDSEEELYGQKPLLFSYVSSVSKELELQLDY